MSAERKKRNPEEVQGSIAWWCAKHGLSRQTFYNWERDDPSMVPLAITVGGRRVITPEAEAEWYERRVKAELEKQQEREEALREKARARVQQALAENSNPTS